MNTPAQKRALLAVFQQHWENARHIKNERLSFTDIYAIASASFIGLPAYRLSSGIGGE